ncbi:MAG: ABC transporter, substrate-binding protein (cluster 5, nickel/peptides/opines), partial [uncultured Acetobacteraceae bacterium]
APFRPRRSPALRHRLRRARPDPALGQRRRRQLHGPLHAERDAAAGLQRPHLRAADPPRPQHGAGARAGRAVGAALPHRVALPPPPRGEVHGRHALHRGRRGVQRPARARPGLQPQRGGGEREGGAEDRRPHGGVRDNRAEPHPGAGTPHLRHHVPRLVGEEQRDAPRRPDLARGELRHPQRHGHRAFPPRQPRARPPHGAGAEPGLVGQAHAQPPARRVHHHRQRRDARGGAALGRDRLRLHRSAAGRGPHPPHAGDAGAPGAGTADHLPRHGPDAAAAPQERRARQEPVPGRAGAPRLQHGDRHAGHPAHRDARPVAPDRADLGPRRERLPRGGRQAHGGGRRGRQAPAGGGRLPERLRRHARLPERPLRERRGDLHRGGVHAGADRRAGDARGPDPRALLLRDQPAALQYQLLPARLDPGDRRRAQRAVQPGRHAGRHPRRVQQRRLLEPAARRPDPPHRRGNRPGGAAAHDLRVGDDPPRGRGLRAAPPAADRLGGAAGRGNRADGGQLHPAPPPHPHATPV